MGIWISHCIKGNYHSLKCNTSTSSHSLHCVLVAIWSILVLYLNFVFSWCKRVWIGYAD